MKASTLLTLYEQRNRVSYQRSDGFITHATALSAARPQHLDASLFRALWDRMLVPTPTSIEQDLEIINALAFSLLWMLRLYEDEYPDDGGATPRRYLENFFAVPLQFLVTGVEFLNHTFSGNTTERSPFALPDASMRTSAAGGAGTRRLKAQTWAVALWTATSAAYVLLVAALLVWAVAVAGDGEVAAPATGIQELETALKLVEEDGDNDRRGGHEEGVPLLSALYNTRGGEDEEDTAARVAVRMSGVTCVLDAEGVLRVKKARSGGAPSSETLRDDEGEAGGAKE